LSIRSRLITQLERHPVVTTRVSAQLRRVGAKGFADRLVAAADIVTVTPPYPGARALSMVRVKGADQIAGALGGHGWLGFERPLPDVFATLVRATGGLVLDVGANTGFYALVAVAVAADDSVEVHAFEPFPPVIDLLRANLAVNRSGDRIRVFEVAIGAAAGNAVLHVPDPSHGLIETSASLNPEFRVEGERSTVDVAVTTLDAHVASAGRGRRVGVIKVDVESLEHEVLAGASELLARDRPYVIVEVLPTSDIEALEVMRSACSYVDVCVRPDSAVAGSAVAFDPDGWNHLFVPEEKLDRGLALVESCGLKVER
jgi:FkbM family methyltransferase